MSDTLVCPECGYEHSVDELEMYEIYDEDGKETELDCHGCDIPLLITSVISQWQFDIQVMGEAE